MMNYRQQLEEQLDELKKLYQRVDRDVCKYRQLPDEHVRVTVSHGNYQYYYVDRVNKTRSYAKVQDIKKVKNLVQRDYDRQLHKQIKQMISRLEYFLKGYDVDMIEAVYSKTPPGKRALIKRFTKSDEEYIEEWRNDNPGEKNTFPIESAFETNGGEKVRSKSEKIIADALDKYNIPYSYEPMLIFNGYYSVFPDFVALNVREKKHFYWEHFGMISNGEYASKNFRKLQDYENNGHYVGKDLIITFESVEIPLNTKVVENIIKEFLL